MFWVPIFVQVSSYFIGSIFSLYIIFTVISISFRKDSSSFLDGFIHFGLDTPFPDVYFDSCTVAPIIRFLPIRNVRGCCGNTLECIDLSIFVSTWVEPMHRVSLISNQSFFRKNNCISALSQHLNFYMKLQ